VRTPDLIASVTAAIEEDRRLSMETIAAAKRVSEKQFQHCSSGPGSRKEVGKIGA
jgi:hypothetical protein